MLRAVSTRDVPLATLHAFGRELAPEIEVLVDESQITLLSTEPPSWVSLFATAQWWQQALAAAAALYFGEIAREAGKDTWRSRASIAGAARGALARMADGIATLHATLRPSTRVVLGLSVPDEYFGTRLEIKGRTAHEIERELALFMHFLPQVEAIIESEQLTTNAQGPILLTIQADESLEIGWVDRGGLEVHTRVLPARPAA